MPVIGIRYVLLSVNAPLTRMLERDHNWKVTYRDAVSVLFEKTSL